MNTNELFLKAFDDGQKAYWAKQELESNPYIGNEVLREEWNLGFARALKSNPNEL